MSTIGKMKEMDFQDQVHALLLALDDLTLGDTEAAYTLEATHRFAARFSIKHVGGFTETLESLIGFADTQHFKNAGQLIDRLEELSVQTKPKDK